MDASQLPMSPTCELFFWTGAHLTYLIKMFPHILKRGSGDYRRLLHFVGFISVFILQPAEAAGPVLKKNKNEKKIK